jgi:hypothetical protein
MTVCSRSLSVGSAALHLRLITVLPSGQSMGGSTATSGPGVTCGSAATCGSGATYGSAATCAPGRHLWVGRDLRIGGDLRMGARPVGRRPNKDVPGPTVPKGPTVNSRRF